MLLTGADVQSSGAAMLISGVIWSSADGEILSACAGADERSSSVAILIPGVWSGVLLMLLS